MVETYIIDSKLQEDEIPAARWNQIVQSTNPTCLVYKKNSTYYIRKSLGSEVKLFNDENYSDLMNYVILDLYDNDLGGWFHHRPAAYYYDKTINMRPGINMFGENRGGADDSRIIGTCLIPLTDVPAFKFDFPDIDRTYQSGIYHMRFDDYGKVLGDGKITNSAAILINATNQKAGDIFLDNLNIMRFKHSVHLDNNHATNPIWNVIMTRCWCEVSLGAGLKIESSGGGRIFQSRFLCNHFYDNNKSSGDGAIEISGAKTRGNVIGGGTTFELENKNAIHASGQAHHNTLSDLSIADCGAGAPGTLAGIDLNDVDFFIVAASQVFNDLTSNLKWGVHLDDLCTYNNIVGNILRPVVTAGLVLGAGAGNEDNANIKT